MGQSPSGSRRITIGSIQLDPDGGHIWKDGVRSYLPEQPLAVLQALLDANGGTVRATNCATSYGRTTRSSTSSTASTPSSSGCAKRSAITPTLLNSSKPSRVAGTA